MDFPLALVVPESLSGAISTVRDERLTDMIPCTQTHRHICFPCSGLLQYGVGTMGHLVSDIFRSCFSWRSRVSGKKVQMREKKSFSSPEVFVARPVLQVGKLRHRRVSTYSTVGYTSYLLRVVTLFRIR